MTPFARSLFAATPMTVAAWMARCNAHYYATRDPLGVAGDFITAPEISQMFGELLGAWVGDLWLRAGLPPVRLVELGPGRGTLMADMLRSIRAANARRIDVAFVETSPALRNIQASAVPDAAWYDTLADVPEDRPLLIVANEFFDALPIRQFVRLGSGWHEAIVVARDGRLAIEPGPADATALVDPALWNAAPGSIAETSPASTAIAAEIGLRLRTHGGAALIIDYGHAGPVTGDTLQAVRAHASVDPLADPGEVDLTAHVDFSALARAAGVATAGPVGQGDFLRALGIDARAAVLKRSATGAQRAAIDAATARLTGDEAMGRLFKVMALTGTGWPAPAGFAA